MPLPSTFFFFFFFSLITFTPPPSLAASRAPTRVQCGRDFTCSRYFPICCGTEEPNSQPYCLRGGYFCCDHTGGSARLGCPLGTSCCIATDGSDRSCCGPGQSCTGAGRCVGDNCTVWGDPKACVAHRHCGWCCATGKCQARGNETRCGGKFLVAEGTEEGKEESGGRTLLVNECPDRCTFYHNCTSCRAEGCEWCCSQARCGSPGSTGCSPFSIPQGDTSCSVCERNGKGVVVVRRDSPTPSSFWWFVTLVAMFWLFHSLAGLFLSRFLRRRLIRRWWENDNGPSDPGGEHEPSVVDFSDHPNPSSRLDLSATFAREYGATPPFTPRGSIPHSFARFWDEIHDDPICVVCLEDPAGVWCAPCGHVVLCVSCWKKLQQNHISQSRTRIAQHRGSTARGIALGPPPCVVCREPIVGAIYLRSYLETGKESEVPGRKTETT